MKIYIQLQHEQFTVTLKNVYASFECSVHSTTFIHFRKSSEGKKGRLAIFPSPAGMSITRLSLAKNNLSIPGQGEFG